MNSRCLLLSNRRKKSSLPFYVGRNGSIGIVLRDRGVDARQMFIDAAATAGLKAMRRAE